MAHVQIINGVERRRRWSESQKRDILAAAFVPGAVVSAVARQADLHTGQIYRWRRQLRATPGEFARVVVAPDSAGLDQHVQAIELAIGTARIRIPASTHPDLAAAVVSALVRR